MIIKKVSGQLQCMSADRILSLVDQKKMLAIKENDPNPLFKAFSIGHEGKSTGTLIGLGAVALKWMSKAIKGIFNRLDLGTKLFAGHGENNSHDGREVVGEVVGKSLENIEGIEHTIAIAYIKPGHKNKDFDCASFEGDITIPDNIHDGEMKEEDVKTITGIALAKQSIHDKPAFSGAVLQGALQMLDSRGGTQMTEQEILAYVTTNWDKLKSTPIMSLLLEKNSGNEYQARKRTEFEFKDKEQKFENEKKEWETEKAKYDATIAGLTKISLKVESETAFEEMIKERKLEPMQAEFLKLNFSSFAPESKENLRNNLGTYFDTNLERFKTVQSVFIKKPDDGSGEPPGDNKPPDSGTGPKKTKTNDGSLLNPENNEFLPD